jgi:hypothetical protein
METMQRLRAEREALEPPPPPPRRRGRPTLIAQAQAQIIRTLAQLPEHSPLLARLAPPHLARVAEARRDRSGRSSFARSNLTSECCTT